MNIKYTDKEDSPERDALIEAVLPKQTIIAEILEPLIETRLFKELAVCVRKELEIYRNYPKKQRDETAQEKVETFNPTNNETCFMGKGFKANNDLTDIELVRYRKAIGTIPHYIWGDCTLLEIWGGDHFEAHTEMVTGAFEYGMRLRDECPEIVFHVNPLFKNAKSANVTLSKAQREEKEYMRELMARAVVYGVKTPAQAMKDRKRR